jgi:hypothetical protein
MGHNHFLPYPSKVIIHNRPVEYGAWVVAILLLNRKVPATILGQEIGYAVGFRDFPESLMTNYGLVP